MIHFKWGHFLACHLNYFHMIDNAVKWYSLKRCNKAEIVSFVLSIMEKCCCQHLSLCLLPCRIRVPYQSWCRDMKAPRGCKIGAFQTTVIADSMVLGQSHRLSLWNSLFLPFGTKDSRFLCAMGRSGWVWPPSTTVSLSCPLRPNCTSISTEQAPHLWCNVPRGKNRGDQGHL